MFSLNLSVFIRLILRLSLGWHLVEVNVEPLVILLDHGDQQAAHQTAEASGSLTHRCR